MPGLYSQPGTPLSFVDPFIGTTNTSEVTLWGSEGGTYPGAVAPSGYIQLSPETRVTGSKGYNYKDTAIYYFTCFQHKSGFPSGSSGQIQIMPISNEKHFEPGTYQQSFLHQDEKAEPGYYRVKFSDSILTETTATVRSGIFRFTFPKGMQPKIFIGDAGTLSVISGKVVHGSKHHVVLNFNTPLKSEKKVTSGTVFFFNYSPDSVSVITIRCSVSSISFVSAQNNINKELREESFEDVRNKTARHWQKLLSVVEIKDDNKINKEVFYTALYHSLLLPWVISDVEGNYSGKDGIVHKTAGKVQYGGFSPWDTFRSLHPLLALLYPSMQNDMVLSLLDIYKQSGFLPIESMTGNHSIPIIADSYFKGIKQFDSVVAYAAMKKSIITPPFIQKDMSVYQSEGYIPSTFPESVTRTVEYAYDDWVLAKYAKDVMKDDHDYKLLYQRSYNYRNLLYVPELFLLPRNKSDFNVRPGNSGYKEGDKWNYSFFVPHNANDLINLMGGDQLFINRLDSALTHNLIIFDNETVFHVPYLFNFTMEPAKTQKWVREILKKFKATPDGLPGNDDLGSLSSWYVFSSMGIYPVCPGRPEYTMSSPIFDSVILHLENGNTFTISRNNTSPEDVYIKSIKVNNEAYTELFIPHATIINGGILNFMLEANAGELMSASLDTAREKGKPEFIFTGSFVRKKQVKPDELFYIIYQVKNSGNTGTTTANVYINGKHSLQKHSLVHANTLITDSIPCRLYAYGNFSVRIESLQEIRIEVVMPDNPEVSNVEIRDIIVKPLIYKNEQQVISFTIQNISGVNRMYTIPVLLNGDSVDVIKLSLDPGMTKVLRTAIPSTRIGFNLININGISTKFKVYSKLTDAMVINLDPGEYTNYDSIVKDYSGFKNDGRIIRSAISGTSDPEPLLFGKDCFIELPHSASLDSLNTSLTMMTWIYPLQWNKGLVDLFTKGDSHVLQTSNKTLTFFAGGWGRGDCTVDLPPNWVNNWHHIAGVCDGTSLKVYINGKLAGSTVLDSSISLSNASQWYLGRNEEFPSERIFNGYMKGIKIFVEPLSAEEIKSEMNKTQIVKTK